MASFNPAFWELPVDHSTFERIPSTRALWFETPVDRERRYAFDDFFRAVGPFVVRMLDTHLTQRQREIVHMYYFERKTQEDIAVLLGLTQSTVSRHLFGTARRGKKIGGAIPKLRKAVDEHAPPAVHAALQALEQRLQRAV